MLNIAKRKNFEIVEVICWHWNKNML
jgi:hypothetical protein